MASEEERAKILAEYYASAGKDNEEEEADFDDYDVSASEEEDGNGFASADSEEEDDDTGLTVTLTGRLSCLPNSKLMYKGSWGEKNKFKLRAAAPIAVSDLEAVRSFLDNPHSVCAEKGLVFDGYFETDNNERIDEKNVDISFDSALKVSGNGSNQFGKFELSGQYDAITHSLTLEKCYKTEKDQTNGKRQKDDKDEEEDRKIPAKKFKNDDDVNESDGCEF